MKKDLAFFLTHILESINNIESFTNGISKSAFKQDILKQSGVIRQLEIMGEAVKNLPIDFTVKYPYIEWSDIAKTRDKIIHDYFGINLDIIWEIILTHLPKLKKNIIKVIEDVKNKQKINGIK